MARLQRMLGHCKNQRVTTESTENTETEQCLGESGSLPRRWTGLFPCFSVYSVVSDLLVLMPPARLALDRTQVPTKDTIGPARRHAAARLLARPRYAIAGYGQLGKLGEELQVLQVVLLNVLRDVEDLQ